MEKSCPGNEGHPSSRALTSVYELNPLPVSQWRLLVAPLDQVSQMGRAKVFSWPG